MPRAPPDPAPTQTAIHSPSLAPVEASIPYPEARPALARCPNHPPNLARLPDIAWRRSKESMKAYSSAANLSPRNSRDVPAFTAIPNSYKRSAIRRWFSAIIKQHRRQPHVAKFIRSHACARNRHVRPSHQGRHVSHASRKTHPNWQRLPPLAEIPHAGCRLPPPELLPDLGLESPSNARL